MVIDLSLRCTAFATCLRHINIPVPVHRLEGQRREVPSRGREGNPFPAREG